jgi:hypothetical protein
MSTEQITMTDVQTKSHHQPRVIKGLNHLAGLSIAWRPLHLVFFAYFGDMFFSLFSIIWGHSVMASC